VSDDATQRSPDSEEFAGWFARWRATLAWVALVLAALVVLVSSLTIWVKRQALNTDSWVDVSGQLLEEPAVQSALANYLVEELSSKVDVSQSLQQALPSQLDPLAAAAAAALRGAAVNQAQALLASPTVQDLWERANRRAHSALIAMIDEKDTPLLKDYGGNVVLDLRSLLDQLRAQVGLPPGRLPLASGRIVVLRADQLEGARTVVRDIRVLSIVLALVALALFAAAIWLGEGRRRRIITAGAWSLILISVILGLVRRLGGKYVVDSLVSSDSLRPAANATWYVGTQLLRDIAIGLLIYGIFVLIGVWLSGPGRRAVGTRRALAPVFRTQPWILFGAVVLVMLILLLFGPGAGTRTYLGVLVLAVGLLAGTELLRRQTLREFPQPATAT
jgi:hypothetical protein